MVEWETNPQTQRRKMAQVLHALDKAIDLLEEILPEWKEHHPGKAEGLICIRELISFARMDALQFWHGAWGSPPDDYNVYR